LPLSLAQLRLSVCPRLWGVLQLAHLMATVSGQESDDHAKILVEVAWVLSFLTGGAGEAVPAVVEAGLLNALASHVHRESAQLTAAPNTPETEEANHARAGCACPATSAADWNFSRQLALRYLGADSPLFCIVGPCCRAHLLDAYLAADTWLCVFRSRRLIPFVRSVGNIAAMEEDTFPNAVMAALVAGGGAAVVPALLGMLSHGPTPLHRLLRIGARYSSALASCEF